mmetsp:Transcript_26664/g.80839  ORF Transcript_26664/g.80839 Transcript_26664/m.80839 type:complete len:108 (-) Transcript_26664:2110-2433(-)
MPAPTAPKTTARSATGCEVPVAKTADGTSHTLHCSPLELRTRLHGDFVVDIMEMRRPHCGDGQIQAAYIQALSAAGGWHGVMRRRDAGSHLVRPSQNTLGGHGKLPR